MSSKAQQHTPVMRQFLAAKEKHPDALVFFRLGDFYELFFDDAVVAARVLDLTLTSRNKGAEDEIPMAGVPYHAASGYIQKLLDHGFKVALCEQMADPSKTKGIVPREVVRVVTPGIVYDDAGLEARKNLFLAAIEAGPLSFGIAALDLSTGELLTSEARDEETAIAEIVRLEPRELLFGPGMTALHATVKAIRGSIVTREEHRAVTAGIVQSVLPAADMAHVPAVALSAAGRVLSLAQTCEPGRALPVRTIVHRQLDDTLGLDESTQAHLELVRCVDGGEKGSLLHQLDETKTAFGARLLRRRLLAPLTDVAEIRRRLDVVELFVTQPSMRALFREKLTLVADVERLATKLAIGRVGPRDLAALRESLAALPAIERVLSSCHETRVLLALAEGEPLLDTCEDVHAHLARAIAAEPPIKLTDGGVIREGYDADLDESRRLGTDGQRLIVELEARLRESTQVPSLKLRFTRVFGWYIEVTRSHVAKVPSTWRRKQTVSTGERFSCEELDDLADKLAHAEERCASRESELFSDLVHALTAHVERLRHVALRLAAWDVAAGLADVAHRYDYTRPDVNDSSLLAIEDGRHPVVERLAALGRFVPNDVLLSADEPREVSAASLWLVTGPNMAGKSTLMRQVALIVIMAQVGSFVPARRAQVGVVDRVLTRVGASDNVSRGESTFMVEMKETAHVLRRATKRSLVVLDEIGRGTSTYDGLAIAWAVAEHLHDVIGCRAMFATHYHELTDLAETRPTCQNWSVTAREHEGDIVFLHKLQKGAASRSYGVACARLAGLPELVLGRAKSLLEDLERGAALPSGGHATMRARGAGGKAQLDLFGAAPASHPAIDMLRAMDVNRLTPIEALQLVVKLKSAL